MKIVFAGRPNSGKSSLIRALTGIKVKVGKKPGATRGIYEFRLGKKLEIVDMPGFGYMYGESKREMEKMKTRIVRYFERNSENIIMVIHVIDVSTFEEVFYRLSRKGIIPIDVEMAYFFRDLGIPAITVLNKIDKLSKIELKKKVDFIHNALGFSGSWEKNPNLILTSCKNGYGIKDLKMAIYLRLRALNLDELIVFFRK
ncbi:MAG: GTP-binding protein EngB [Candidatus Asgardarchaeia archaeon]